MNDEISRGQMIRMAQMDHQIRLGLEAQIEQCLTTLGPAGESDAGERDIHASGPTTFTVHLLAGATPGARVSAVAAVGLKRTAALLREINEINESTDWAKVSLRAGIARVTIDLHFSAVNAMSLDHAMAESAQVAGRIGPLLTALHGGALPEVAGMPADPGERF